MQNAGGERALQAAGTALLTLSDAKPWAACRVSDKSDPLPTSDDELDSLIKARQAATQQRRAQKAPVDLSEADKLIAKAGAQLDQLTERPRRPRRAKKCVPI